MMSSITKENILLQITDIFRNILEDDAIILSETTTALDIDEWDSLAHISIIIAIEKKFGIQFLADEIGNMQNVGAMIGLIAEKLRS